jgi:pseudouridylate synthase
LVANPLPDSEQLDPAVLAAALASALADADAAGIRGKEVSPFLLDRILQVTGGASLEVNLRLARGNIALAAQISQAFSERLVVPGEL